MTLFGDEPGLGLGGWGWAMIAAALGTLAAVWGRFKTLAQRVSGLCVKYAEFVDGGSDWARDAVLARLMQRYRMSSNYVRLFRFVSSVQYRNGAMFYMHLPAEEIGKRFLLFWKGWWPILYIPAQTRSGEGEVRTNSDAPSTRASREASDSDPTGYKLVYLRGTFDLDALLADVSLDMQELSENSVQRARRYVLRFPGGVSVSTSATHTERLGRPWFRSPFYRTYIDPDRLELPTNHDHRAVDALVFPQEVQQFIRDVERWRDSRQWYSDRGIPWRRGVLLYGKPGTGKTALTRAIGRDLNLPVAVFQLNRMSDHEFRCSWRELQSASPCIVLFEDFDNVFHGRTNITPLAQAYSRGVVGGVSDEAQDPFARPKVAQDQPLQFDTLLDSLDGIESCNGIFVVITTNLVEHIDEALGCPWKQADQSDWISSRPGRLDKAIELKEMTPDDRLLLVDRLLHREPTVRDQMYQFYAGRDSMLETPAQVQERCVEAALRYYWSLDHGQVPKSIG